MNIKNAFGLKNFKNIRGDDDTKRGEDGVGVRVLLFKLNYFCKVALVVSVKDNFTVFLEFVESRVSERAVAKKDDLGLSHRGRVPCCL